MRTPSPAGSATAPLAADNRAAAWIVTALLAAMFATAAWAKTVDYWGFIEKAVYYRSVSYDWIHIGARATIAAEWLLAILLASGLWLRRFTVPIAAVILLMFSGLIIHAWVAYGIEDCACLGSLVETPPWLALTKNSVMLLMMWWLARRGGERAPGRTQVVAAAAVAVGVGWWVLDRLPSLAAGS